MRSRSVPAEISSAAPEKILNLRGRSVVTDTFILQAPISDPWWHANDPFGLLQLEFVRKRYHKDILNSPVLMLNFCPDLLCEPLELHKATRELLFLVDRSGSMSGPKIHSVKVRCRPNIASYRFFLTRLFILSCFNRKPWWLHWRVSPLAPSSTLWASAPPSSLCSPPASSALMLVLHNNLVSNRSDSALFIVFQWNERRVIPN